MRQLLDRFRGPEGAKLLQRRGSLIVCRLAALLGGRRVFRALAAVLADADDLRFVSALVQALNLILLTAPEASRRCCSRSLFGNPCTIEKQSPS